MTRIVGFSRPGDDEAAAEEAALRAAGADQVFVERDTQGGVVLTSCLQSLSSGDVLVVTRASRLTSTQYQFVRTVAALGARGVGFRSLAEPALTTGTPVVAGEVFQALEELRSEMAGIRTRAGMDAATGEGRRPGRPKVMTEERLAMATELRAVGRSISHIARVLGVSAGAVRRALADVPLTGSARLPASGTAAKSANGASRSAGTVE